MNKITIELHEEDRKRLDLIYYRLGVLIERLPETVALEFNPEPAIPDAVHPVDAVSPHGSPEPAEAPAAPAAPTAPLYTQAPLYTLDDVRAVVQRLIGPGSKKRDAAKALVEEYAPKLSAIPVGKYPELLERLNQLEKEAANA